MTNSKSLVILISGNGSNLQAIIDSIAAGQVQAKIRAVISNVPDVYGLERAQAARIPTEVIDHREYDDRETFDRALTAAIENYSPDLVVMAGFMRLLGERCVNRFLGRMINIHPSLLPKYPGLDTHQRAIDAGDEEHGASVHFVTPEVDAGPIVIQCVIDIDDDDTAEGLAKRVLHEEHEILPIAVRWFVEGRLAFDKGNAYLDQNLLEMPAIYRQGSLIMPERDEA